MKPIDRWIASFLRTFFTPNIVLPLVLLLLLSIMTVHAGILKKTVYGDGIFYVSWLRSAVVDRNIEFSDEYAYFGVSQPQDIHGMLSNKYSIGPSILWSFSYIPLHTVIRGTGFEFPYQLSLGISSVLFGFTGLLLLYRMLAKFVDEKSALASVVAISCATPFLFYGSVDPINSHAIAFFSVTVFLSYALSVKPNPLIMGIFLGCIGLVRPLDMLVGLVLFPVYRKSIPTFLLGIVIGFFPQMFLWSRETGNIFISPYILNHEGFVFPPHLLETLFSPFFGIFTVTPMILLSSIGFFLPWKKSQLNKRMVAITLTVSILAIASWSTYWQGATYGNRMFLSFLPLAAFPLSHFLSFLVKRMGLPYTLLTTVLPFGLFNAIAIILFLSAK